MLEEVEHQLEDNRSDFVKWNFTIYAHVIVFHALSLTSIWGVFQCVLVTNTNVRINWLHVKNNVICNFLYSYYNNANVNINFALCSWKCHTINSNIKDKPNWPDRSIINTTTLHWRRMTAVWTKLIALWWGSLDILLGLKA